MSDQSDPIYKTTPSVTAGLPRSHYAAVQVEHQGIKSLRATGELLHLVVFCVSVSANRHRENSISVFDIKINGGLS